MQLKNNHFQVRWTTLITYIRAEELVMEDIATGLLGHAQKSIQRVAVRAVS